MTDIHKEAANRQKRGGKKSSHVNSQAYDPAGPKKKLGKIQYHPLGLKILKSTGIGGPTSGILFDDDRLCESPRQPARSNHLDKIFLRGLSSHVEIE